MPIIDYGGEDIPDIGSIKNVKKVFDGNWKNIDHEKYRIYEFPRGDKITIDKPLKLLISESGGHRILDYANVAHYIPKGWIHLYWETKDGVAFRF